MLCKPIQESVLWCLDQVRSTELSVGVIIVMTLSLERVAFGK